MKRGKAHHLGGSLLGAPVAYLAPVAVLVGVWFALSWIWRTPRPSNGATRLRRQRPTVHRRSVGRRNVLAA